MNNRKYNIGCGRTKLDDYINVDINPGSNVDIVCDIRTDLFIFPASQAEEILCFHTLEHIERNVLPSVLFGFSNMLKMDGKLVVSFPDFEITSRYFLENKRGMAEFWEKTIFGRNDFPHDSHKSALTTKFMSGLLTMFGFVVDKVTHEFFPNECNAIIFATKKYESKSYEKILQEI